MGERGKIFDQIILAAPDIDRDVFRTQLLPRMAKAGNRTTMYCSRGDLALHISYTFNDAPRAGDSSRGILVTSEMDTVDASGIDTALLGHSYYGDCGPILNDVRQLVDQDLGPEQRQLKPWPFARELKYWTFPTPEDSTDNKPPNTKLPDVELKDAITAPDIP
jgi:esterase/lipase superfamily enzyme